MKILKAEIITIGDELLLGQTIDTNSAWIGNELHKRGIEVYQITSITDQSEHIVTALMEAESRCDLIFITGGLGPTKDDLTKQTLVNYFGTTLVLNQIMYDKIESFFKTHNLPMIESNIQQAYLPKSCTPIINEIGTAAGMWFEKGGKVIVSMPGVPHEMKKMMEETILPKVISHFDTGELIYRMVYTIGIGESFLVEKILDWENSLEKEGIHIAYLPERGKVKLRLLSRGYDRDFLIAGINKKITELQVLISEHIVTEDQYNMAANISAYVGELLKARKETVATAESCTGGAIASSFTEIAGSSGYFLGSVVAYHENIKASLLGVSEQDIVKQGVVSKEVAEQMALGVVSVLKSDWGVATTGYAGPSGGHKDNPIGTVWIAVSYKEKVVSERIEFDGNRLEIIEKATEKAFMMLKDGILSKEV